MRNREDLEAYLVRSSYPFEELEDGTWLVTDPSGVHERTVVRIADGLVLFRVRVLDLAGVPADRQPELYATLLELNTSDMVHGAYGVSSGHIVLVATLRLENLDYNEFVGTLDDFGVALAKHAERIRALCTPKAG